MWEDFGKALTNVAFAGVGLAALAAEQVVKAGKVLAEKGEIYVEQGKRYGEELQQKLQEDAQRRREEQLEQRISAMDAQEREALRRRLAELDELELSESTLTTITSDTSNAYNDQLCEKRPTKYAYDFHFNFYCLNSDGTPNENWNKAVANRAFRRCFQEGLNLIPYYARFNKINPLKCENNYYTMKGVCLSLIHI